MPELFHTHMNRNLDSLWNETRIEAGPLTRESNREVFQPLNQAISGIFSKQRASILLLHSFLPVFFTNTWYSALDKAVNDRLADKCYYRPLLHV